MTSKTPVYLWTGEGWGKSTSAIGVALRAVGHGRTVTIIQFMKGWGDKIGEYKVRERLQPEYEIYQFGSETWIDLENPKEEDIARAKKGLEFAKEKLKEKPFLLILDEINIAVAKKLIEEKDVLDFIDQAPEQTTIYLTGRYATPALIKRSNFATEIKPIKKSDYIAGEGIDY
ncbi:cob(I)yrinic acid a,c-diamide adenosyltransferase [Nanoarchaeota archaeon]